LGQPQLPVAPFPDTPPALDFDELLSVVKENRSCAFD
jgi:hypothetical protein